MTASSALLYPEQPIVQMQSTKTCECKTCLSDGAPQSASNFSKNRKMRDGLDRWCKTCRDTYNSDWREKKRKSRVKKEKLIEYVRVCIICGIEQSTDKFQPNSSGVPQTRQCNKCRAAKAKAKKPPNNNNRGCQNVIDDQKMCSKCREWKPLITFYKNLKYISGYSPQCKKCQRKYYWENRDHYLSAWQERISTEGDKIKKRQKDWYMNNPDKNREHSRKANLKRFGVDEEWYENTLRAQGGKCAICRSLDSRSGVGRRFAIDHDHNCCPEGRACDRCRRGLLCFPCNTRLKHVESGWANAAMEYLQLSRVS